MLSLRDALFSEEINVLIIYIWTYLSHWHDEYVTQAWVYKYDNTYKNIHFVHCVCSDLRDPLCSLSHVTSHKKPHVLSNNKFREQSCVQWHCRNYGIPELYLVIVGDPCHAALRWDSR